MNFPFIRSTIPSKCYGHRHDLIDRYGISVSQWPPICSTYRKHFTVLYSYMTYYWVCNYIITTSATSGSGFTDPSGVPEFIPVFSGTPVTRPLALYVCPVYRCFSFCTFSFRHYVVCSLIYGFWLPLWSLQTLLSKVIELLTISSANIWNIQN
jgi:hypothetical protein